MRQILRALVKIPAYTSSDVLATNEISNEVGMFYFRENGIFFLSKYNGVGCGSNELMDSTLLPIAQNVTVFRDIYLQCPVCQRAKCQFGCLELISCDWSTNLALNNDFR